MHRYTFCETAEAGDLEPVVLAIHEIIHRLPVTAKSLCKPGIRIEDGRVIDRNYTGPVLEQAIATNSVIKTYAGKRHLQGCAGNSRAHTGQGRACHWRPWGGRRDRNL